MKRFMLDQSLNLFMQTWATRNGWKILSCSSKDSLFGREYASKNGATCVPCPRIPGNIVIVHKLQV